VASGAERHSTPTHCGLRVFPRARLPPASIVPRTATMPRPIFAFAVLPRGLFRVALPSMTMPPARPL